MAAANWRRWNVSALPTNGGGLRVRLFLRARAKHHQPRAYVYAILGQPRAYVYAILGLFLDFSTLFRNLNYLDGPPAMGRGRRVMVGRLAGRLATALGGAPEGLHEFRFVMT